jgi:hypothetical protein
MTLRTMTLRTVGWAMLALTLLASCERDLAPREELFLPELKLGTAKHSLESQLAAKYGFDHNWDTIRVQEWPTMLGLGYASKDSSLMSVNYRYLNASGKIDDSAIMLFQAVSDKAIDRLGTPDDWIRRDTVSGQRIVWYYNKDSSVVSLEQRRAGDILFELTRSGQRYRDVKYEMDHFLMAPN